MKKVHIIAISAVFTGLAIIIGCAWYFLVSPVKVQIEAQQKTLDDTKKKLVAAETAAAQYEKFRAESENVTRNLAFVRRRLGGDFSENDIYQIFNSLGSAYSLEKYSYKLGKIGNSTKVKGTTEYPVEVKFSSDFHDVGNYLNGAVSLERLVVLEEVQPVYQG